MSSLKKQKQDLVWEKKWRNMIHQRSVKEEMNKQLKASLERQKREEEEKECTFKPQTLWNQSFRKTVSFVDEFFVKLQPYIEQQQAYLKQLKELEQEDKLFAEKVKEELRSMLSKAVDREIMETIIEGYKGVRTRGMNKVKREKLDILSKMIKLERDYNCFMARENVDKRDLEECGFDCDLAAKLRNDILKESLCPNSLRDFAKIRQEINNVLEEELQISENKNIENDKKLMMKDEYEQLEEDEEEEYEEEGEEYEEEYAKIEEEEEEEEEYYDEEYDEEKVVFVEKKEREKYKKSENNKEVNTRYVYDNKVYFKKEKTKDTNDKTVKTYMKGNNNNIKWNTTGAVEKKGGEKIGIKGNKNFKIADNVITENTYIEYEEPIFDINGYISSVSKNNIAYSSDLLHPIDTTQSPLIDSFALRAQNNSYYLDGQTVNTNSPTYSKKHSYQHPKEPKLYLKQNGASSTAYINEQDLPFEVKTAVKNMIPSQLQPQPHIPFIKEFLNESSNQQPPVAYTSAERLFDVAQTNIIKGTAVNRNNTYANIVHSDNNINLRNAVISTNPGKTNNKSVFLNNNYMKMLNREEAVKYASNWKKEANTMNVVILNDDKQENAQRNSVYTGPRPTVSKCDGVSKIQSEQNTQINGKDLDNFITFSSPLHPTTANKNMNWNIKERNGTNKDIYAGANNAFLRSEAAQTFCKNKKINTESGINKNTIFINKRTPNNDAHYNKLSINNFNAPCAGMPVKTITSNKNAADTNQKNSNILKLGLEKYRKKEFPLFKKFV